MIYLDYSANTPADEAVLQRFCEVERNCPGNANSRHAAGTAAKAAIDAATQSIARSLNVQPAEIIYTSGASEANNFAIKSIARLERHHGKHVLHAQNEHAACAQLARVVNAFGVIDLFTHEVFLPPTELAAQKKRHRRQQNGNALEIWEQ